MEARGTEEMLMDLSRLLHRHLAKLGADQEDAKDIVQDAICKWLLYADAVPPERAPARMFRVAVNAYYDLCRRRKRHVAVALDDALLVDSKTPETAVLRAESAGRARAALSTLRRTTQDLLLLKYAETGSTRTPRCVEGTRTPSLGRNTWCMASQGCPIPSSPPERRRRRALCEP